MPSRPVLTDTPETEAAETDVEQLSRELREQMKLAKDRISDRYAKLIEPRSFDDEKAG